MEQKNKRDKGSYVSFLKANVRWYIAVLLDECILSTPVNMNASFSDTPRNVIDNSIKLYWIIIVKEIAFVTNCYFIE